MYLLLMNASSKYVFQNVRTCTNMLSIYFHKERQILFT